MADSKLLTEDDFKAVFKALYPARIKWWIIGLELGIQKSDLDEIKSKVGTDAKEGLMDMITKWLKTQSLEPTWESLVTALRDATIGEEALAVEIEEKYVKPAEKNEDNNVETQHLPSVPKQSSKEQTEPSAKRRRTDSESSPTERLRTDSEPFPQEELEEVNLFCEVQSNKATETSTSDSPQTLPSNALEVTTNGRTETSQEGLPEHNQLPLESSSEVYGLKATRFCTKHSTKNLKVYCESCKKLICRNCTIGDHPPLRHQHVLVQDTFPERITEVRKVLQNMDARTKEIKEQRRKIEADIDEQFKLLHKVLEERKTKILGELNDVTQRKLDSLATERDKAESLQTQLSNCLDFTEDSLDGDRLAKIKAGALGPCEEADMLLARGDTYYEHAAIVEFDPTQSCVSDKDQAATPGPAFHPRVTMCRVNAGKDVASKSLKTSFVNQNTSVTLDTKGQNIPPDVIDVELVCCQTDKRTKPNVETMGVGRYRIQYRPVVHGKHKLNVKIGGIHTEGSPYDIDVKKRIPGSPVPFAEKLDSPRGITTDSKGRVLVTGGRLSGYYGSLQCRVTILTAAGEKIKSFGNFGHPSGIAVDEEDNIYVVDHCNSHVIKYTSTGDHIKTVGSKGNDPLQFSYPSGIAVSTDNVYVCDQKNHRIQKLTKKLEYLDTFGSEGSDNGQLQHPSGIWVGKDGLVLVCDTGNHRIQSFSTAGEFIQKYGDGEREKGCTSWGDRELGGKWFTNPSCIAVDPDSGRVFVTEKENGRVVIMNTRCHYLRAISLVCSDSHPHSHPWGITVDSNGCVLVADEHNGCILKL